jgi:hypothetical protein
MACFILRRSMSKPWKHAVSAARKFGGVPEDYLAIHTFMDTSKAAIGDNRHRVLTHHSAFLVDVLVPVFGETFTRQSDGKVMSTRDIGEQHNDEDYGGWMPTATDFINEIPLADWMFGDASVYQLSRITRYHYRLWQSLSERNQLSDNNRDNVWSLFNYGMRHASDIRGYALTHNAWFINTIIPMVYSPIETHVCIQFLEMIYGKVPTAQEWVMDMPLTGWMNNGRGKAPSQAILFRQKRDNSMNRKAIDND